MYSFETFKEYVVANINTQLPEELRGVPEVCPVNKASGSYTGLCVKRKREEDNEFLPTLNLEGFFELYRAKGMEETMSEMAKVLTMPPPVAAKDLHRIMESWEEVRKHLIVRLTRLEELDNVKDGPYEIVGDIIKTYSIAVPDGDGGVFSARLTDSILENFGVAEKEAKEAALLQMEKNYPLCTFQLGEEIHVVTSNAPFGAAALFYPGAMRKIADELSGSYYAIPSSVYEWICVPEDKVHPEQLQRMVKEANITVVEPCDVLSDSLYHYDAGADSFDIVPEIMAEGEVRKYA